jgi:hypothetical protein
MVTEFQPAGDRINERMQKLESSMQGLNSRIARLAIGLGVSLQNENEMAQVMSRAPIATLSLERRTTGEHRQPERMACSSDRRTAHHWVELRGLLVSRCHTETRSCARGWRFLSIYF